MSPPDRSSRLGLSQAFPVGDRARVEQVLEDLRSLGISELRTTVSWAEAITPEGRAWYAWLMKRLTQELDVVPCFVDTPAAMGLEPRHASPPRELGAFGHFVGEFLDQHGERIDWVQLWDEPGSLERYDWRLDVSWNRFISMISEAAGAVRARGKKVVLGGMSPPDPLLLAHLLENGLAEWIDAVAVNGYPESFDAPWPGWQAWLAPIREVLQRRRTAVELWVTQAGYSTWRHDEQKQVHHFLTATAAPVDRLYWDSLLDEVPSALEDDELTPRDERTLHFGMKACDGTPKLLFRLWSEGGLEALAQRAHLLESTRARKATGRAHVIFGGAGFIGSNLAHALLSQGKRVRVFDSLARGNVEKNLQWLKRQHGDLLDVEIADVRDAFAVRQAVQDAEQVFHFAAQVAVTTSLTGPIRDFEVNGRGTINVLEALRQLDRKVPLLFTSTNKVYGGLTDLGLRRNGERYEPVDSAVRQFGISEARPLEFESPYGCSKGAADQYVLDYSRSFGLETVVFRMSCIYGPRQFGNEDQGWVAHFLIQALENRGITLYGDGHQVRDVLFVEDLVRAFQLAMAHIGRVNGQAFNIGGGPTRTTSLLELLAQIEALDGHAPKVSFEDWRVGDQRYYVSDTRRFQEATGWTPRVSVEEGVRRLHEWLRECVGQRPERRYVAQAETEAALV